MGTHAKPCRRSLRWSSLRGHEAFEGSVETGQGTHANPTTGIFGGAPYEATKIARGAAKLAVGRMRTLPREPSVELPLGPRSGHETCEGCAEHWLWGACEPCRGSFRRSSLWGNETCEGCAEMGWGTHANPAAGAFDGAPDGATKRVRGVPTWTEGRMRTLPQEPSVELPMGLQSSHEFLKRFCWKTIWVLYGLRNEKLQKHVVSDRFRHARAADAHLRPAWSFI